MKINPFTALSWLQRISLLAFTGLVLAIAVMVWERAQSESRKNAEITFQAQVDKVSGTLSSQIGRLRLILDSSAAFWMTNPHASQSDWRIFVERLSPWSRSEGLNAIAFVQAVERSALDVFLDRMHREVAPDFTIRTYPGNRLTSGSLTPRDNLFIVTHFSPYQRYREKLLGLDLGAEIVRRKALEKARDDGAFVLSDPVLLVISAAQGADFLAVAPVYRPGFPLLSVQQRRAALQGWVTIGLNGASLAQGVISPFRADGYDISLFALDSNHNPVVLLEPAAPIIDVPSEKGLFDFFLPAQRHLRGDRSFVVGGNTWAIVAQSSPQLERRLLGNQWGGLVAGVALALALAAGVWLLMLSRQQSRLLADSALAALDTRERHYKSVVEGTAEGYWQIDPLSRRTVEVNSSLCAMLEYDRAELIGQSPSFFCHPSSYAMLEQQMGTIWTTKHRKYELTMVRKNGELLFAHVAASTLRDRDGGISVVFAMITDITEVVRMREALEEKTRALEATNSDLKQFAYVASHDLQAPLRSVSSYLQLLVRRYRGSLNEEAREFIDFAVNGAHRMAQLINDLLSFSRLEQNAVEHKPVSLQRCYDKALQNLEVAIATSHAHMQSPPSMPVLVGDQAQLTSLFQNLIGNALKYHRAGVPPAVEVSCREMEDHVEITVADHGIGIPEEQYERIFLIFQRLHGPEEYEGTGIGLALCKRIVERHGGKIWVEPNHSRSGEIEGAIFRVSLPVPRRELGFVDASDPPQV